jgi:uncharacterized membrane protein (DUF4010 family)
VLNPQQIWLMVVLIVGISLGGYVAYKFLGPRSGGLVAGVLGGLISSTATTVSYARRTRQTPSGVVVVAALVIVAASAAAFARVLAEIAVVAPNTFWRMAAPLGVMLAWMVAIAAGMSCFARAKENGAKAKGGPAALATAHGGAPDSSPEVGPPVPGNPAELKTALIFAGLYALVLLGVAATRDYFGAGGLFGVAVASGLHDLDAITLSTARFVEYGQVEPQLGWRLILAASLSNLVFKAAAVVVLGAHQLPRRIAAPYAAALLGGMALLLLWPEAR